LPSRSTSEAEAWKSPQPWEADYDDMPTGDKGSRLDLEVEQLLGDTDWDDDPSDDCCSPQHFYRNWEHGYGADDGRRTASPVVISAGVRAMPATSATRVREETAQSAEAAETGPPSQVDRDLPAAREERLTSSGMSAGVVAAATNEEEKEANYQARIAARRASQ
jgi:hypothetical protein